MSDRPDTDETQRLQIQIDEDVAQGIYTNLATVTHSPTEFVLDFIYVQPQQPKAKVRSRVITSPQHVKRILAALQENVARFEERFGPIGGGGKKEDPVH